MSMDSGFSGLADSTVENRPPSGSHWAGTGSTGIPRARRTGTTLV